MRSCLIGFAWLAFIAGVAQAATMVEDVRATMEDLYEQFEAAGRAQAAGNQEMMQKHQRNAQQFLQEARTTLEEAGADDSNELDVLVLYAEVLGLQREYDLAAEILRRAVIIAPNNPALWRSLGRALSEVGPKFAPDAHAALRRALDLQPPDELAADIHQIQGRLFYEQGLYELARRSYDAALAANASTAGATLGLAALDIRQGKVYEAQLRLHGLESITQELAIQVQPLVLDALKGMDDNRAWFIDSADNHRAYAMLLLQANHLPSAIDPLERALTLAPDDHVTWNLLASAYRGLGNKEREKVALQRSLDIEPNQPRTLELLKAIQQSESAEPPASIAAPPPSIPAPPAP